MQKIKKGDVVTLKKAKMTVRSRRSNRVTCDWFDDKNKLHRKTFNKDELILTN